MNQIPTIPSLKDIETAYERIKPFIHKTPVLTHRSINELTGGTIFFKCENLQKAGAFKFRGASNAVFSLKENEAKAGVATHSSGNHAQALALAAKMRGIKAFVVMPNNAPKVKIEAVKGYGAKITFCEPTLQAREEALLKVVEETGAVFIPPYDDSRIIAGQGTATLELLAECPELDVILAPVGGGGLISGTALAAKSIKPAIKIIAAEPELADDANRSFKAGRLIPLSHTNTIADGLRTSLSNLTFSIISTHVNDIVTVGENSIIAAMRFFWERTKMIIEPSSAVPLAAIMDKKIDITNKKIGVILSGGNVDLGNLPWY